MNISVIGTGYVGITTAVCLAAKGHNIICVDKDKRIIDKVNRGEAHIYEPMLEELLQETVGMKKIFATADIEFAISNSDVTIITVGTPYNNGEIDLSYIELASKEIGEALSAKADYHVVCVKSTVVPGTTEKLVRETIEKHSGKILGEFGLGMNPEFLREGTAVHDFLYPDRIVIGAYDDRSYAVLSSIYYCFPESPLVRVNIKTAELIKYASNTLLATLISYSNEIATIAETLGGVDAKEVLEAVHLDKRLNPVLKDTRVNPPILDYLKVGCGFGGSCFPKDVSALIAYSTKNGYAPQLLEAVMRINEERVRALIYRLGKEFKTLKNKRILVLGAAFKADTDDIRESPGISFAERLLELGSKVCLVDPLAIENAKKHFEEKKGISFYTDMKEVNMKLDAVILATSWSSFKSYTGEDFKALMKKPIVLDGRRLYSKEELEVQGIKYIGAGI